MTHDELVKAGERWLRKTRRLRVVLSDVRTMMTSEQPDVIGWSLSGFALLIECKASRADFLRDRHKPFRKDPARGMGAQRFYMTPAGLVTPDELPSGWGLLEVDPKGRVHRLIESARFYPSPHVERAEKSIILSALCRATEGWGRKMFGDLAPSPTEPGDPHPSASKQIKMLWRDNASLRAELQRARRGGI